MKYILKYIHSFNNKSSTFSLCPALVPIHNLYTVKIQSYLYAIVHIIHCLLCICLNAFIIPSHTQISQLIFLWIATKGWHILKIYVTLNTLNICLFRILYDKTKFIALKIMYFNFSLTLGSRNNYFYISIE